MCWDPDSSPDVYELAIFFDYIRNVQDRRVPAVDELIADANTLAASTRNWLTPAGALIDVVAHAGANSYAIAGRA